MTEPALVLVLGGCALAALGPARRSAAPRRVPDRASLPGRNRRPGWSAGSRYLAAGLAALGVAVLLGSGIGVLCAVGTAVGLLRLFARLEPAAARRRREDRTEALPITLDLLAVGLRAGAPLVQALEVVATATRGSLSADLARIATLQRLGAGPAAAWSQHEDDPVLGVVARAVRSSAESGARLASAFERLAVEQRSTAAATGEARARRAGVLAMAPLGLCFLPAFVCLGVVPLILSIASTVFS